MPSGLRLGAQAMTDSEEKQGSLMAALNNRESCVLEPGGEPGRDARS